MTRFSMPLEPGLGTGYVTELHTLLVTYPLCGSALTDTMDNSSGKHVTKLSDMDAYSELAFIGDAE